eukprot:scaffold5360_cov118-Isochrysis_galbana.AAC.1
MLRRRPLYGDRAPPRVRRTRRQVRHRRSDRPRSLGRRSAGRWLRSRGKEAARPGRTSHPPQCPPLAGRSACAASECLHHTAPRSAEAGRPLEVRWTRLQSTGARMLE